MANLRSIGIAELLTRLDDSVLQLAIQRDSWEEPALKAFFRMTIIRDRNLPVAKLVSNLV